MEAVTAGWLPYNMGQGTYLRSIMSITYLRSKWPTQNKSEAKEWWAELP